MSTLSPSPANAATTPPDAARMTPAERRASASLALVFALRMLGLFIVAFSRKVIR